MRRTLKLHPQSHCDSVSRIEVDVVRHGSHQLLLRYFVTGKMDQLRFPPASKIKRGEKLWEHSCFEAFLRTTPAEVYYELNFAPSYEWTAYGFDGYRDGMRDVTDIAMRYFVTISNESDYELRVSLNFGGLPNTDADTVWHLGLSAVIEEVSGNKSYWALAHPPGGPDFHHRDCFALQLPPQEQT